MDSILAKHNVRWSVSVIARFINTPLKMEKIIEWFPLKKIVKITPGWYFRITVLFIKVGNII